MKIVLVHSHDVQLVQEKRNVTRKWKMCQNWLWVVLWLSLSLL